MAARNQARAAFIDAFKATNPDAKPTAPAYAWRQLQGSQRGLTKAASRGHGFTPEHGGALDGVQRTVHGQGFTIRATYSDTRAEGLINKAADAGNRVAVHVHTREGGWQELGKSSRGFSATYVAQQVATQGDIRGAFTALAGHATGSDYDWGDDLEAFADDIDAWQVVEYES